MLQWETAAGWLCRVASMLLAAAWLGACQQPQSLAPVTPSIRIGADTASAPLAGDLLSAYESQLAGTLLTLDTSSREATLSELASGEIDAALLLYPSEHSELFSTPIGYALLYITVSSDIRVDNISVDNLRAVFSGRIVSWKELGGPDIPIQPVTEPTGSSERLAFEGMVMGTDPITSAARLGMTSHETIGLAGTLSGGIGYGVEGDLPENTVALAIDDVPATLKEARSHRYPLIGTVIFSSNQEPDGQLRAFLDWIVSDAGQQIVRRHMLGLLE